MALLFGYTPKEEMVMTVITGTPVGGGVDGNGQCLSGDRTQLTLSGVQR